jgi:hypothetical protein
MNYPPERHADGPGFRFGTIRSGFMSRIVWNLSSAWILALLTSAAPIFVATRAQAACSSFSAFQSLPVSALTTLQVKLTFVGVSDATLASMGVTAFGNTFNLSQFSPCQLLQGAYSGDMSLNLAFATTAELQTLIANVATLPAVTAGGVATVPYVSFSLSLAQPSNIAFEAVLDQPTAATLFPQIASALANEKAASQFVQQFGCGADVLPAGKPTDVTNAFTVKLSGVRLRRDNGLFVGDLTVANNSGGSPAAPVSVVLKFTGSSNVKLANPDGMTCVTPPGGQAYINLSTIPAQGSSVTVPVEFSNPDSETITVTSQVLAGPGSR